MRKVHALLSPPFHHSIIPPSRINHLTNQPFNHPRHSLLPSAFCILLSPHHLSTTSLPPSSFPVAPSSSPCAREFIPPSSLSFFRNMMRTALLLAAIFVAATVEAQTLRPYRTSAPPIIDGSLDDPVWKSAPMVTGLKTFAPDFDKDQEQKTEVLMAYDAENLYFAYRCFDDRDKIKTSMAARDNMRSDDWVCLNLDTFGDAQGLTALYINPFGIQQDSPFAGGREDFSVDFVWYSGGRLTPDGYDVANA